MFLLANSLIAEKLTSDRAGELMCEERELLEIDFSFIKKT